MQRTKCLLWFLTLVLVLVAFHLTTLSQRSLDKHSEIVKEWHLGYCDWKYSLHSENCNSFLNSTFCMVNVTAYLNNWTKIGVLSVCFPPPGQWITTASECDHFIQQVSKKSQQRCYFDPRKPNVAFLPNIYRAKYFFVPVLAWITVFTSLLISRF